MTIRHSPDRHTFQSKSTLKKLEEFPEDELAKSLLDWYDLIKTSEQEKVLKPEWKVNNLEHDLRVSDYIAEKCKDDAYAQNLYAAMCNREFVKNEIWPILQDKKWGCSWRHAGGIIADIQQKGDYIDWYCSGICDNIPIEKDDWDKLTPEQQTNYNNSLRFVSEGEVTDEIKEDLLKIGWIVVDDSED